MFFPEERDGRNPVRVFGLHLATEEGPLIGSDTREKTLKVLGRILEIISKHREKGEIPTGGVRDLLPGHYHLILKVPERVIDEIDNLRREEEGSYISYGFYRILDPGRDINERVDLAKELMRFHGESFEEFLRNAIRRYMEEIGTDRIKEVMDELDNLRREAASRYSREGEEEYKKLEAIFLSLKKNIESNIIKPGEAYEVILQEMLNKNEESHKIDRLLEQLKKIPRSVDIL